MRVKTWIGGLLGVVAAVSLTACKPLHLKTDPTAEAAAQSIYDDVAAGRADAIHARLTPMAVKVTTPQQILSLRPFTEPKPPLERRLINMEVFHEFEGPQTQSLTYELAYPDRTVLYRVTLKRPDAAAAWQVETINLNKATRDELAKSQFTLNGRSPGQLLFLAATILSPLLMLSALVAVIRAPGLKRKWLWSIVAFAGIGTVTMNWTTGQTGVQPFMLNLVGAGIVKQGASGFFPWILKFTLPVGAVLSHWQAARARRAARNAVLDAPGPAA